VRARFWPLAAIERRDRAQAGQRGPGLALSGVRQSRQRASMGEGSRFGGEGGGGELGGVTSCA